MGQSSEPSGQLWVMTPQDVADRVNAFIRRRHPSDTAKRVGMDANIPPATVRKWLERSSAPNTAHMGRLMWAYGAGFTAEVYPGLYWLDAARIRARSAELLAEQERITRELAELRGC